MTAQEKVMAEVARCDKQFYDVMSQYNARTVTVDAVAKALGRTPESVRTAMEDGWDGIGYFNWGAEKRQRNCVIIYPKLIRWYRSEGRWRS